MPDKTVLYHTCEGLLSEKYVNPIEYIPDDNEVVMDVYGEYGFLVKFCPFCGVELKPEIFKPL